MVHRISYKCVLPVFSSQEYACDVAPTARRMPARGNAPGITSQAIMSALKGRRDLAPFQGAKRSVNAGTQGIALGLHSAALSAPEGVELF